MNWKDFWNNQATKQDDALKVGRAVNGKIVDDKTLQDIAAYIAKFLELKPTDSLLDICCGNGMLTKLLAPYCKEIIGIDLSEKLISEAKTKYIHPKISYFVGDASQLSAVLPIKKFDKILLYFSFQYIETNTLANNVFKEIHYSLNYNGLALIGDIPDAERLHIFYPSIKERIKYFVNKYRGKNEMGRFWHPNELDKLAITNKMLGKALQEPSFLPFSHYRFDYLLSQRLEFDK